MQNNIIHKLPKVPATNESMREPGVFACIVCRCFQQSFGVKDSELSSAFFGQYLYHVNMQVPDYPYLNIAAICAGCHWKVATKAEHDCLGCEPSQEVACTKIIDYLQSQDWSVCTLPQCSYCVKEM